eukprot:SAG31_NODE_964_length_10697_cov_6.821004_6_plen_1479_part_01
MHLFAETELTEAEGMPLAIWFTPIYAKPFIDFVRGLHVTLALPLCLDVGSSFKPSMQCLSSDHDCNCNLDACGTHHSLNGSLLPTQQDHSDSIFFTEPECFQFGRGSAYESDLSSSTVQCTGFESRSLYGSDVPFSDKTSCRPSEPGPTYTSASPFLTETRWLPFDSDTAHEPTIRFLAENSFDLGFVYESDVSVSNMSVRQSFGCGYESEFSSSTLHCSGSDPGSSYGSDILFLAEIAVDAEYAHGCGPRTSNILPLANANPDSTSFADCEIAACDDVSVPSFSLSVERDSLELSEESYNSKSSSDRSQVRDQHGNQLLPSSRGLFHSHNDGAQTSSKQAYCGLVHMSSNISISVCISGSASGTVCEIGACDDEIVPPFSLAVGHNSLEVIEESRSSNSYSNLSQVKNQRICSQFAASISGSPSQSHVDDVETVFRRPHVSYTAVHSARNDSTLVCDSHSSFCTVCSYETVPCGDETKSSFSLTVGHDSSSHRLLVSGGLSQSHGDGAHTGLNRSRDNGASVNIRHNSSISAWGPQSTYGTVYKYIPCAPLSRPLSSFSMQHHDWSRLMAKTNGSDPASSSVQSTNQPTCIEVTDPIDGSPSESHVDDGQASFKQPHANDAGAHMSRNGSISAYLVSQSTFDTGFASSVQLEHAQLVCSDALSHNRTHGDVPDVGSESRIDDVEDIPVGESLSADHEQYTPVYDFFFETLCIGHVFVTVCGLLRLRYCMIIAYSLLQWYCSPKKLEERPKYLRRRCELEALDAKLKLSCASTRLRRCVALAKIRKRFRAWRIDTKNEKYDRIGYVVGVAFLLIAMFQPVAEGSALVSVTSSSTNMTQHHNETALVNASNVHTDMNQLAALNDADLKEFIGSLAVELRQLKRENVEIRKENAEMKNEIAEVQKENVEMKGEIAEMDKENVQTRSENAEIREQNAEMKSRMDVLQSAHVEAKKEVADMKMKNANMWRQSAEMKGEVAELKLALHETSNITRTETEMLTAQVLQHGEQLDQCKEETSSFVREMERRRLQTAEHCEGVAMQTMLASCCPTEGGGGHRRELQSSHGCAGFPDTCSASCTTVYTEFYESCHESIIASMPATEQTQFDGFYNTCTEAAQQAAAALEGASPAMIFHVVVIDPEAEQQAAMFNGGSSPDTSHFGPVDLPNAPPPTPASGAVAAQEFRVVCTLANLTVCTPECNSFTYGFLLSMEVDGRGTVMTCNVMDGSYAWQGQASLGGFIGSNPQAFLSAVLSGASGTYLLRAEGASLGIDTDITIRPGQRVQIIANGAQWGRGTITIQDQGSLELVGVELFVSFTIDSGTSALSMSDCEVILPTPLVVPTGSNVTMRVDRTRIGVVRTVDTFSSFQLGIAVDGELTMQASDLIWGSNVYVGIWAAEAGHLSCAPCGMDMTPLGMYSLYQEGAPRFALPHSSQWQDLTTVLHTLEGHNDRVRSVAFDASGGTLASGSNDQTVKLWDVASGECLR